MEKNTKFPQSSSSKGTSSADSKKTQDVTNSKLFPKSSQRREPAGASNFPRCEQSRKCNVQKAKNFVKRPKSKGQYHGGSKEDTKVVEPFLVEPGSVVVQGSKKQNLNHLLNFHYEARNMQGASSTWNHGKSMKDYSRNSNRWLPPTQRHKYNKDQFLQASCQFVVTANGIYTLYLSDPDALVNWKLVEQIKIPSSERLSCPICLSAPVAGKMTRCGHVYCWPCILHYLSLSDKLWRKCPICYELVQKSDLKSVVEIPQNALNSGDNVTLRLMRREKGSLLAVPVGSGTQNPSKFFPASEIISKHVYSKLLIASTKDVLDIIERERVQLKCELMDNLDSPENCYIEQALNELLSREEELTLKVEAKSDENSSAECTLETMQNNFTIEKQQESQNFEENKRQYTRSVDEEPIKTVENSSVNNIQTTTGSQKMFYFYQADDGQHLYLHAMNVKMLEMQYGSLENSPHTITGTLLEKEGGSLTEDLRRRLRYLCHLPITCQFEVAEIELKPPIVSEEVLQAFQDQIILRQKCRQRRERDERKREKKITEEENKQMGKYPTPIVHINSQRHFPQWQPELLFSEEGVPSPLESAAPSSVASSPSLSAVDELVTSGQADNSHDQGPSFAEMLQNKGSRVKLGNPWPSIKTLRSKPSSSSAAQFSNDAEEEDYASVPSYSQSFGDALARALEQTSLDAGVNTSDSNGGGKKRKRKKSKPTVLFATSMARSP